MVNVAVLGAGSWGTTLAKVFADAGNPVSLWARREELARTIQDTRENPDYLPGIELPAAIQATSNAAEALENAAIVVFGVPSQTMRDNLTRWAPHLPGDATLVSISKGVESGTHLRMSEIIAEVTGVENERIAVLTGPNLSREVAEEQPAATVIACADENRAKLVQAACATSYLRPYTNTDVVGCEIGGATKNVIALACGMAAGNDLPASVLPFILRGVQLVGINSVDAPNDIRDEAWSLLDESVDTNAIRTEEVGLDGVVEVGRSLLDGGWSGRAVVKL